MTAGSFDITIEQGATFQQDLIWTTGSPATPVNVTGYTGRMQIRNQVGGASLYYSLTTDNGRLTFGTTNGMITLYIPWYDTSALSFLNGVYDLDVIAPGATPFVTRLIQGAVTVADSVTKP